MGYTQNDLSKLLSVKSNTISNYENSVSEPTIDQVFELIKIFDISSDELLFKDLVATSQGEMLLTAPAPSGTQPAPTACPACKEKDERIAELKDHISTLKINISSLEKASAGNNTPYSQTT